MDIKRFGRILAGGLIEAAAVINVLVAFSKASILQGMVGVCLGIAGLGYLVGNTGHKIIKKISK